MICQVCFESMNSEVPRKDNIQHARKRAYLPPLLYFASSAIIPSSHTYLPN